MHAFHYRIKAPAKINARLKVTGRRPDGYHELVSVMIPVDLFDVLDLKIISRRAIDIAYEGYEVPTDETNLAHRAAASFFSRTGIDRGVTINLAKRIPVAAGLGGGSSDAAATILALNRIFSKPLSNSDLNDLALKLGADVPFFLNCVPSLATGIGEILKPINNWPEFNYLIITPPIIVPTSWVYGNLKMELTTGEYNYIVNFLKDDTFSISRILENDLEKVTSASFPIINTLKKLLMDAGAEGAMMTGSGPSVFGLFSSRDKAESAKDFMISRDLGDVFLLKSLGEKDRN